MATFYRTTNRTSFEPLSDEFVILAEKCLLLSNDNTYRCDYDKDIVMERCVQSDVRYISLIMYDLLHSIPLYLDYYHDGGDPLGEYRSNKHEIALFPDEIRKEAKKLYLNVDLLAAITLIHELAHAFLDPHNHGMCDRNSSAYRKYYHSFGGQRLSFYHVREESMANIIAYRNFNLAANKKVISSSYLRKVKLFISLQPDPYRMSLALLRTPNIWGWVQAKEKEEELIDDKDAEQWMKKVDDDMRNSLDEKQYSESLLEEEMALELPWAFCFNRCYFSENENLIKETWRGYDEYGDSLIEVEEDVEEKYGKFFSPNYLVRKDNRYFLYNKFGDWIVDFPCDAIELLDNKRFLLHSKAGSRCLNKDGLEVG